MNERILVVDDDMQMRLALKEALVREGYFVALAEDVKKAKEELNNSFFDLVITDVKMPREDGVDLLKHIKKHQPLLPVVLITAYGTINDAVKAIKEGAFDYIQKPFTLEALYAVVRRAIGNTTNGKIVYGSKKMKEVLMAAERVAKSDVTVFILGESGVGKELISRYIHEKSERRDKPFIPVNCASIPENLLESELFGFEKGAFTGATYRKAGKFELADKGTILLDEITEMDLRLQSKILRVLQEKEIEILGARYPKKVDVRVIATSNRDVKKLVAEGKFREDLYYRLNVFPIVVPPLRERREDIPPLVHHMIKKYSKGMDVGIEEEAMEYLVNREWKGNVRELENAIARACILSDYSVIKVKHLEELNLESEKKCGSLEEMETKMIIETLRATNGNRTKAAKLLGITTRTLRNKIKEYKKMGITVPVGSQ
ncbi:MAG: sigma-54 dependent transcriptional regulator [Deltaproteobacteria bacterium]|nr:sigma-54 dependent transcriptional regulator [Deltaproteobacteria bacterium]